MTSDPFWTVQRAAIVSLFVGCAGLGQAIASQQGLGWPRFWQRWRQIALCALAVSIGSWWMFPQSYIYFGILHGMAVLLIVARLLPAQPRLLWPLALLALALPGWAASWHRAWPELAFLDSRAFNWLGLISHKPLTEDYAPVFPWLGVMCAGLAIGHWLLRHHAHALQRASSTVQAHAPLRALAWLGRWSLSYYMVHQPMLLALLGLGTLLR